MSAALATRTGFKFMISVRQGPDQGASYQLLPPRVTIGRAPENNIVFKDPKISRVAAQIEFTLEQITITDVSGRKTLFVNGEQVSRASIKDGDSIQLGETEFSFAVEALILAPKSMAMASATAMPSALRPPSPHAVPNFQAPPQMRSGGSAQGGNKLVFYVVLIAICGGAYFFFSKPSDGIKKEGVVLRTADAVEKDTHTSESRTEEILKKRAFKSDEERTRFEEAQKHYLEGFRDYQKSQFMRAMRSFETALAIDPDHQLARRYHKLAEKRRDENVAFLSLEGRRYRDKHMYARCTAAFEKVMESITNKDDAKFKEADAIRTECQLLEDERFQ